MFLAFAVWMYALSLSLPPLFGWGSYGPEAGNVSCSVSWEIHDSSTNSESYIGFLFVIGLVLPVVVIVTSYFAIVTTTFRVKRKAGKNGIYGVNEGGGREGGRGEGSSLLQVFNIFFRSFLARFRRCEGKTRGQSNENGGTDDKRLSHSLVAVRRSSIGCSIL